MGLQLFVEMALTVLAGTAEELALIMVELQNGCEIVERKQTTRNIFMKYFTRENELKFFRNPSNFDKHTPKKILQYAIGANMYVPAIQETLYEKLTNDKFYNIGALTLCMEDSIEEEMVSTAENNILQLLKAIYLYTLVNQANNLPLIFIRVRSVEQFKHFAQMLNKDQIAVLCGFSFPKFNSENGTDYFSILQELSLKTGEILYGMPIIEDKTVMYKERRVAELQKLQQVLKKYEDYVLNIRVGGTDFSSIFGLRRDVFTTIYDIIPVVDCLTDIINFFMREECQYVLSGPVWEYYAWEKESIEIVNLKKELLLDIQNGFQGKTIIHPSQIEIVNKSYVVKYEDYQDAVNILQSKGGVFACYKGNGMNEANPHRKWAEKIMAKAEIFGVANVNTII